MMRAERGRDSMTAGALQRRGSVAHGIANEICAFTLLAMRNGWGGMRGGKGGGSDGRGNIQ